MARININVGTNANDGTGDDLRTAMQKINTNFAELYGADDAVNTVVSDTAPKLGGNLDINGWDITSSRSNENIRISPNGTGDLIVTSDIVPSGDNTQELGSNSKRWKEIHIGPGSLSFWDIVLNTRTQIEKAQADLLKAIDDTGFTGTTAAETKAIIDTGFDSDVANRFKQADDAGFIVITDGSTNAIGITNARTNGDVVILPNGTGVCVIDELEINGAELTPTNSNTDIVLTPTGTGVCVVDELQIDGADITPTTNDTSIVLTPTGTGSVVLDGSATLKNDVTFEDSGGSPYIVYKNVSLGINQMYNGFKNDSYTQSVTNTNETYSTIEYLAATFKAAKITLHVAWSANDNFLGEYLIVNTDTTPTLQLIQSVSNGTSPVSSVTADYDGVSLIRLRVTTPNTISSGTVYKWKCYFQLYTGY